jgi:hypothetical protein
MVKRLLVFSTIFSITCATSTQAASPEPYIAPIPSYLAPIAADYHGGIPHGTAAVGNLADALTAALIPGQLIVATQTLDLQLLKEPAFLEPYAASFLRRYTNKTATAKILVIRGECTLQIHFNQPDGTVSSPAYIGVKFFRPFGTCIKIAEMAIARGLMGTGVSENSESIYKNHSLVLRQLQAILPGTLRAVKYDIEKYHAFLLTLQIALLHLLARADAHGGAITNTADKIMYLAIIEFFQSR